MFTTVLVHDLGEDFGMMPDDFEAKVRAALKKNLGNNIDDGQEHLIKRAAQNMERMTHDRHYTLPEFIRKFGSEFKERVGEALNILVPKTKKPQRLTPEIQNFLWPKMDVLDDHKNSDMQVFVETHKGKPRITFTRYGRTEVLGACWHLYTCVVGEDPYTDISKRGDSVNGMTSRLSIKGFTKAGYAR